MNSMRIFLFFALATIASSLAIPIKAQQPSAAAQTGAALQLVIIDTDIGDDMMRLRSRWLCAVPNCAFLE